MMKPHHKNRTRNLTVEEASHMNRFRCHKVVNATPMTRGDYNLYRGWELPADENGADEGYLVIYSLGTADHYESWSPKGVFDAGYAPEEGPKYNKVPVEHITRMADSLRYELARVGNTTVTGCWAFLPGGFQVAYGESACIDPANFDQAQGEKCAKESCEAVAVNKLWELEGYLLKTTGRLSCDF